MNWENYECEGQMTLSDWLNQDKEPLKFHKNIRLIEAFCGVGSQAMSLRDLGIRFEHWRAFDIDRFAINSYNAIHGTDFKPTDISKVKGKDLGIVDRVNNTYLLTYSFPCTDLSISGLQKGMAEGSGTRSSLLWEIRRILNECGSELPQILLMENVPMIHSKANMPHFSKWLKYLESKGYTTIWQDLQAKEYGIPQSRNRTIAISFLGNFKYDFPKPIPLDSKMGDYLELGVEDKFYIYTDKAWQMIDDLIKEGRLPKDILLNLKNGGGGTDDDGM